jgi:hypothetical protein
MPILTGSANASPLTLMPRPTSPAAMIFFIFSLPFLALWL